MSMLMTKKKKATGRNIAKVISVRRVPTALTKSRELTQGSVHLKFDKRTTDSSSKEQKERQYKSVGPTLTIS